MSGSGRDADTTTPTATREEGKREEDGPKHGVKLRYVPYGQEKESAYLPAIRQLISKDLSEPYSIYVYRYFLYQWGDLCFMVCPSSNRRYQHGELMMDRRPWTKMTTSSESSSANSSPTAAGPCEATSPCWPPAPSTEVEASPPSSCGWLLIG
jgi:hypothetical protein